MTAQTTITNTFWCISTLPCWAK